MSFLRTFGQLKPSKPVLGVAVKVIAHSDAKVTDIQLNPGSSLFSWSPMVGDLGLVTAPRWRFINGMIQSDYDTFVTSDEDQASPYRGVFYPVGPQEVNWGQLHFGEVSSKTSFDGYEYSITTGAGITPHLTARADQRLDLVTTGLMSAIVGVKGISVAPGNPARTDLGSVTAAHPQGWNRVWAFHDSWSDVLAEHGAW